MSGDDWTVDDVAGLLRDHRGELRKCCLLVGAGVSLTAGIGTGPEFVKLIREHHSKAYLRAERKANGGAPKYNDCMSELTEFERSALVRRQIEAASINWAHIGIGRLEAAGCVDRILTTNFDPLASRACALFNNFPAVYDLAALRDAPGGADHARFIPAFVSGSAIYHLHGQHTGFLLLNTQELLESQAQRIEPALLEAASGRTVIVCGYSGENDPLVERLARQGAFPHGLIWVRHDEEDPCGTVTERLLSRFDDCHVVRNKPADLFFTELANALGLDQPAFLTQPFKHLDIVLDRIRPFSDVSLGSVDLLEQARTLLREAQQQSQETSPDQSNIAELMAQRRYQEVIDRFGNEPGSRSESEQQLIAWALIMLGNDLNDNAIRDDEAADALFAEAEKKYVAALAINPESHDALYNWGVGLTYQARKKKGDATEALFAEASKKFAAALAIKPDNHKALNNWSIALTNLAKRKEGDAAEALFAEAAEKCAAAMAIKPEKYEALSNWGVVLMEHSKIKQGAEAAAMMRESREKYELAETILPGSASYNLACLNALGNDAEAASLHLRQSKERGVDFPGCDHIIRDSDFDSIRDSKEFKAAMAAIGC